MATQTLAAPLQDVAPEPAFAAFVALDWGDRKHAWTRRSADSDRRERGELEHTPEAVDAWITEYLARFPGRLVAVCLEQKRGALIYMLSKYSQLVLFPVHPATLSKFRAALYPSGSKDDPVDADLLLDLLTQHRDHLRQFCPDTVETRKLQLLVEMRRSLVDERTAQSNRLTQQLKFYFPQVLSWFEDVHAPIVGAFLERWPTLAEVQRARPETLVRFFHQHHSRDAQRIQQRIDQIATALPATTDAAVIESSVLYVHALVQQIACLQAGVAAMDDQIAQVMAGHPEAPLFAALPGAGPVMAPRLVAAFGTQRERFASAAELQAYSGIAPVRVHSGKGEAWIHFRWACPKFLRQTFHEWAGHSIAQSAWASAYYQQQRANGSEHHAAVRALAFKWQRILFRCWKDGKPYDEQTYVEALRRRGSPLYQKIAHA